MSVDRRTHIAKEILSTERTFVKNLRTIVDVFLLPLRLAIEDGKPIIKQRSIEQIFSNIEEIMRVSVQFHFLIEQRVETWTDNPCIGDVFMEVIPEFNVYDKYLMDHHRAIMTVTELEKRGPFAQFLEVALQRPECENLDVLALLILPVQRILRYKLFLEDLIKCTPDTHPDYKNLETALSAVLEKAAAVNASIRAAENYEKLCQIQKSFITQGGSVKNLVMEERLFIREGNLTKVCRKIPKKRWFFLFSDIIIYASLFSQSGVTGGNLYSFHRLLHLSKTKVKPVPDTETQKNAFQIITNDKSFTVFADSPEEKELWLQDIIKATAAKSPASLRDDATAPVWEPDNNGVVCRICSSTFTWVNRRHHCRQCGNLICGACSTGRAILAHTADTKPVRVCDRCSGAQQAPGPGVSISAPTFSHGSSEHTPSVSQIMKDTAAMTNTGTPVARGPSRSGLKPPSTPLPPTPLQLAAQQASPTPAPPSPSITKSVKPQPPVPAANLKRANTVGVVMHSSVDPGPPLPPKPSQGISRSGTITAANANGLAPDDAVQRGGNSPRGTQEPAPPIVVQVPVSEDQSLEAEVQILLANLQKMLNTQSVTSHLSLIERVRFFSNKISEHNQRYNTPPSIPPPSPPSSNSPAQPFPNGTAAKPKPSTLNPTPNGVHPASASANGNGNGRALPAPGRAQHASAGDAQDPVVQASAQGPPRPGSTGTSTTPTTLSASSSTTLSPAANGIGNSANGNGNGNGNSLAKSAPIPKMANGGPSLPVVPPRKAASVRKLSPTRASLSSSSTPILVDSGRT